MSKKYINKNTSNEGYGYVYSEISNSGLTIKVKDETNFIISIFNFNELKEISETSYKKIIEANYSGDTALEAELKNQLLSKLDTTLYCERLEKDKGFYTIYDEEFESCISFSTLDELAGLLRESQEYFTDKILISAYYLVVTNELEKAEELVDEIERRLVGRDYALNLECLMPFATEEFLDISFEQQIHLVAQGIDKALNSVVII